MKHGLVASLALGLAACATAASPLSGPAAEAKGRELIGQMKTAMGGPTLDAPAGFHETGASVRDDGAKMTYETWGDMRSLKSASIQTVDGRQTRVGFDGEAAWHVLPNGAVERDTDAHTLFVVNMATYLSVGGYFYPDRFPAKVKYLGRQQLSATAKGEDDDAPEKPKSPAEPNHKADEAANAKAWDVVEVWPNKTLPINLWLDPQTHRLERISGRISNDETFTVVLDDYRDVDGVWVSYKTQQIDDQHIVTQTVATHTFGAVPAERFAAPRAR